MDTKSISTSDTTQSEEAPERNALVSKAQNSLTPNTNAKDLINILLPNEVLENVLQKLLYCRAVTESPVSKRHPTVAFLRVCRRWYIIGLPVLWTYLNLTSDILLALSTKSELLLEGSMKSTHKFARIKSLVVGITISIESRDNSSPTYSILPLMSNLSFLYLQIAFVDRPNNADETNDIQQILPELPSSCHSMYLSIVGDPPRFKNDKILEEIKFIVSNLRHLTLQGSTPFLRQFLRTLNDECQTAQRKFNRLQELTLLGAAEHVTARTLLEPDTYQLHCHISSSHFPDLNACVVTRSEIPSGINSVQSNLSLEHRAHVVSCYDLIQGTVVCYDAFSISHKQTDSNLPDLLRWNKDLESWSSRDRRGRYSVMWSAFHDNGTPSPRSAGSEGPLEIFHTFTNSALFRLPADLYGCGWVDAEVNFYPTFVRIPNSFMVSVQGRNSGLEVKNSHLSTTTRIYTEGTANETATWRALKDRGIRKPRYYLLKENI